MVKLTRSTLSVLPNTEEIYTMREEGRILIKFPFSRIYEILLDQSHRSTFAVIVDPASGAKCRCYKLVRVVCERTKLAAA